MNNNLNRDCQRLLLPLLLLGEMKHSPGHGYALANRLAQKGFERVKGARLYPVLNRLESAGYCQAQWEEGAGGPGRKVYALTKNGADHLEDLFKQWNDLKQLVEEINKY